MLSMRICQKRALKETWTGLNNGMGSMKMTIKGVTSRVDEEPHTGDRLQEDG